jgi:NitT/TauT family transport system substrate-binding protein
MLGIPKSRRASVAQVAGVTVLVVAAWLGALLMPTPEGQKPLTVAVGMWPGAEPFVLAREAGELPRETVNLVEINWSSAAMRAVGNRVVDATVLSLDEVVRQTGQGYPLKIVLVTDISRGADAVMARADVKGASQLAGLRVGYEPRTAAALMLERYLTAGGASMAQIQEVPINPAELEETFDELALDAVVIPEPWIQRLHNLPLKRVYDSASPGAEVVRVLAVHGEALKAHRGEVERLVRAHLKWMPRLAQLDGELEPILRREGVDRATFLAIMAKLEVPTRKQNIQWLSGEDRWLLKRLAVIAAELHLEDATLPERFAQMVDASVVTAEP